eukprot:gene17007-20076_t
MNPSRFEELVADMVPALKVMTIGPSMDKPSGYQRIKCLARNGVRPALGHDRACTEDEVLGAIRAAASEDGCRCHVTHLFNVSGFHHRLPSLGNFGLLNTFPPGLPGYEGLRPPTVEIITDFKHVHPLTVAAVIGARSLDDVACVTDTVLEPTPGTKVKYLGRQLEVTPDGKTVVLAGTTTLAGSCCTLLDAFKNLVNTLGISVAEASHRVTRNPASIAHISHTGAIAVGMRADLLLLTNGPTFKLNGTIINGDLAYFSS